MRTNIFFFPGNWRGIRANQRALWTLVGFPDFWWWWMWGEPPCLQRVQLVKRSVMSCDVSSRCFAWVERIFPTNSSYHSWWAVDRKLPKFTQEKKHMNTYETKHRIKQLIDIYLEAGSVFGNHHQCFSYFASSSLSWRGPRAVWPTHIPWNVPKKVALCKYVIPCGATNICHAFF